MEACMLPFSHNLLPFSDRIYSLQKWEHSPGNGSIMLPFFGDMLPFLKSGSIPTCFHFHPKLQYFYENGSIPYGAVGLRGQGAWMCSTKLSRSSLSRFARSFTQP